MNKKRPNPGTLEEEHDKQGHKHPKIEQEPRRWRRIEDSKEHAEKTKLDISGACHIQASPHKIVFVDGTNHAFSNVDRIQRLSRVNGHENRSACYRYVLWLFNDRVPTESDIQEMYSQIDIFQYGDEYYLFRKPSLSDLPDDVLSQMLAKLPSHTRFGMTAVHRKFEPNPNDPQNYPKECITFNVDLSDPQVNNRLSTLQTHCGRKRGVLRIIADGPMSFEPRWTTAASYVSLLSKLTRNLTINTVDDYNIITFDLSGDHDSFHIQECVIMSRGFEWLPYVKQHTESGKLTVDRWVLRLAGYVDARVNHAIAFRDRIRQFSNRGIYLAIFADTMVRVGNMDDLNPMMDEVFDGYIVDQPLVSYAESVTARKIIPRVFAPHFAWG